MAVNDRSQDARRLVRGLAAARSPQPRRERWPVIARRRASPALPGNDRRCRAVPGRAVPGRAVPGRAVPGRAVPAS
ncbi:hypothetical protein Ari01nite_10870 [Paractinoplanes rishiriensis]|uniref:Uncharacterized protein n=1 Tax=Paractinoplanes rishiriensis TaxID=1050105 RepID=A0A919MZC5_9ACTN|nr:hypothetical protein Ari01nite_10870 [Actinoplanes rishiriensis]